MTPIHIHKFKRYCLSFSVGSMVVVAFLVTKGVAQAERLESASYVINFGNFTMTSGQKSSNSYSVTDTVGQTAAGLYGSLGGSSYVVGSGFQYIYPLEEFRFSISQLAVNLGELTVSSHNTASHTLTVNAPGANGYKVYASESHPLQTVGGSHFIPDTTCDSGACTEATAGIWTNTNVPGFGFNMTGDDVATDFVSSNYYRQFANRATNEPMEVIMTRSFFGLDRVATVTYKAGIAGTQAAGNYETTVAYVAVPSY